MGATLHILGALEDSEDAVLRGPLCLIQGCLGGSSLCVCFFLLPSSHRHRTTPRWGSDRLHFIGLEQLGEYITVKGFFPGYQSLPGIHPKLWNKIDTAF